MKGAGVLTLGAALAQGLAFARNVIIARVLSPEDVGIAATLAVTLSLVELLGELSIDKLLIQAPDGDEPRFQATAHSVNVLRGVCQSVLLVALAWPAARFFDIPHVLWAFQAVGLGPLVRGLAHLDVGRMQRTMRFAPGAISEVLPQAVSLAVVWPLAAWLNDYRAVLFVTLGQVAGYVVCTHVMAEHPYRWAWDRVYLTRITAFGWPLVINGVLLFLVNQGDRAAIGANYSKAELAVYSNALLLVGAPMLILAKVGVSLMLPLLAACRANGVEFGARYERCGQAIGVAACIVMLPLVLSGGVLVRGVFGPAYAGAGAFVGILACAFAIRTCRIAPTLAAMAHADTLNSLLGNIARSLGVAGAAVLAWRGESFSWIALCGLGGEVAALLVSAARLSLRGVMTFASSLRSVWPVALVLALGMAAHIGGLLPGGFLPGLGAALLIWVLLLSLLLCVWGKLRAEIRRAVMVAMGVHRLGRSVG